MFLSKAMKVNEKKRKKYEAPVTKHIQVELENSICAASVSPLPGDDVTKDRHVNINKQTDGGTIRFTQPDTWD